MKDGASMNNFELESFCKKIAEDLQSKEEKRKKQVLAQTITELNRMYAADVADVLESIGEDDAHIIFNRLLPELRADVFVEFSRGRQKSFFVECSAQEREILLGKLTIEELVDFFDDLSDQEVCSYIKLINKRTREEVLSLLEFSENSAGGMMDSNVFVVLPQMTISMVISILQRLKPNKNLYQRIFVSNKEEQLIGSILLEDLVLQESKKEIKEIMQSIQHQVKADVDKEEVAKYMMRYHLDILPVTNDANIFLGVITSGDLAEILEDEASEDIFRMASLSPQRDQYFDISISSLLWQRGSILAILLLIQSISTLILSKFQSIAASFLLVYIGIITGTGGNASNQSSALVIRGIANGELDDAHMKKFVKREFFVAIILAIFLALVAFLRIFIFKHIFQECIIVGIALFFTVIVSTLLGAFTPFLLRRCKIDPAYAAGPILATCMDIIGVTIFMMVSARMTAYFSW